jgi:hypothetical protein
VTQDRRRIGLQPLEMSMGIHDPLSHLLSVMIMRHLPSGDPKEPLDPIGVRIIGWGVDQPQYSPAGTQHLSHKQRVLRRVGAQVIGEDDRPPTPRLRASHRPCQLLGKRRGRPSGSQLVVEPALSPVDQAKALNLAIVAGGLDPALARSPATTPETGQGRVQGQLHLILQVEVGHRQQGKQRGKIGRRLLPVGFRDQRLKGGWLGRGRPGQESLHPQAFPRWPGCSSALRLRVQVGRLQT